MSAIRAASAYVQLSLRKSGFTKGLKTVERSLANSAAKIRNVGAIAAGVGAAGIGAFTLAVKNASDLGEAVSKTSNVFKESKSVIEEFAETSANAFGISKRAANDYASELGLILLKTGSTRAEAAKMSVDMVKLAADIASMNNISIDEALTKLKAGLVGSSEPLRSVGVLLSENAVKAKAAEMNLEQVNGKFTEGAKVAARFALILEQTEESQGDFTRTSTSLANVNRRILASFENMSASIGEAVLPLYESLANKVAAVVDWLAKFIAKNKLLTQVAFGVVAGLSAIGFAAIGAGAAISLALFSINSMLAVFELLVTPVGLVAAGVVLLGGAIATMIALPIAAFFTVWITQTDDAMNLIRSLGDELAKFFKIAKDTFGGLVNAISVGEWSLAGEIAVKGLEAAILTGLESIQDNWKTWLEFLLDSVKETFDLIIENVSRGLAVIGKKLLNVNAAMLLLAAGNFTGAASLITASVEFEVVGGGPGFLGGIKKQAAEARKELAGLVEQANELANPKVKSDGKGFFTQFKEAGEAAVKGLQELLDNALTDERAERKEKRRKLSGFDTGTLEGLISGKEGEINSLLAKNAQSVLKGNEPSKDSLASIEKLKGELKLLRNALADASLRELIKNPKETLAAVSDGLSKAGRVATSLFGGVAKGENIADEIAAGQQQTRKISSQGTFIGLAASQIGGGSLTSQMFTLQKQQHEFDKKREEAQKKRDGDVLNAIKKKNRAGRERV